MALPINQLCMVCGQPEGAHAPHVWRNPSYSWMPPDVQQYLNEHGAVALVESAALGGSAGNAHRYKAFLRVRMPPGVISVPFDRSVAMHLTGYPGYMLTHPTLDRTLAVAPLRSILSTPLAKSLASAGKVYAEKRFAQMMARSNKMSYRAKNKLFGAVTGTHNTPLYVKNAKDAFNIYLTQSTTDWGVHFILSNVTYDRATNRVTPIKEEHEFRAYPPDTL